MTLARYYGQVVFCLDVPATADLYERSLGFRRAYDSGGDIGLRAPVAGSEEATIEVYLHDAPAANPAVLGTFAVDDVDSAVDDLTGHGWRIVVAAADQPWGIRDATLADPNGHTLTLTGPPMIATSS